MYYLNCFCAVVAELMDCNRDHPAHKAQIVYWLTEKVADPCSVSLCLLVNQMYSFIKKNKAMIC